MPNIGDTLQHKMFMSRLEHCEKEINGLSEWRQQFIRDIREKFESREDAMDLGISPWNPSQKTWALLDECAKKLGWNG